MRGHVDLHRARLERSLAAGGSISLAEPSGGNPHPLRPLRSTWSRRAMWGRDRLRRARGCPAMKQRTLISCSGAAALALIAVIVAGTWPSVTPSSPPSIDDPSVVPRQSVALMTQNL